MEALEELTPEHVKDLTREQAQDLWNARNVVQSRIRMEMELLREKIWPDAGKTKLECESCGSRNIRYRRNKTYFCLKCGFSSGDPREQ